MTTEILQNFQKFVKSTFGESLRVEGSDCDSVKTSNTWMGSKDRSNCVQNHFTVKSFNATKHIISVKSFYCKKFQRNKTYNLCQDWETFAATIWHEKVQEYTCFISYLSFLLWIFMSVSSITWEGLKKVRLYFSSNTFDSTYYSYSSDSVLCQALTWGRLVYHCYGF